MISTSIPAKMPTLWASGEGGGFIRTVPIPSQIGITNGAASWTDGFPPLNFSPVASGGIPPFGQDVNGVLNAMSSWLQWIQAGGIIPYDSSFQALIGGYPLGAVVQSASFPGAYWQSTVENNTGSPDAGAAGWEPIAFRDTGGVGGTPNVGGVVIFGSTANGANLQFLGPGSTPRKWIRVVNGRFSVINNAYSTEIFGLDDSGNSTIPGTATSAGVSAGASGVLSSGAITATTGNVTASTGHLRAGLGAFGSGDPSAAVILNDFLNASSFPLYFYQKFPTGTIIQAFQGTTATGADFVTFPNAFPGDCIQVIAIEGAPAGWNIGGPTLTPTIFGTQQTSPTNFALYCTKWNASNSTWIFAPSITFRYIAVGF